MKFSVVIGNPPYNNGMDIDFVDLAYNISSLYVVMITPAKWQTADGNQRISSKLTYGQFRQAYSKYIKHICYFPTCKDVFDILQVDGITYYLMDKQEHEKCTVENKCKYIKYFNSTSVRSILNRESLFNIGNEIIEYLGNYKVFTFNNSYRLKKFQVWTNIQVPGGGLSTQIGPRQTYFVGESHLEEHDYTNINTKHSDASICSFTSDNELECKSFLSWLNCKFTRFFVAINPSKLTGIICDDSFRFVPAPPSDKFDHVYTDEELYRAFNLPKEYIEVIEAIVKERK